MVKSEFFFLECTVRTNAAPQNRTYVLQLILKKVNNLLVCQ